MKDLSLGKERARASTLNGAGPSAISGALHVATFSVDLAVRGITTQVEGADAPAAEIRRRLAEIEALAVNLREGLSQLAVRAANEGSLATTERLAQNETPPEFILTAKELHVFQLIGRGYGTTEIAQRLEISVKTIETYRARIKTKLVIGSSSALASAATQWVDRQR